MSADEALSADLRKDWEALKDTMMQLGDAMPPDKFTFKPTPELRTFGEQLMHVAGANVGLMGLLDPDVTAPTLPEATEKAEALQALSDSFDFGSDILRGQTSASVQEPHRGTRIPGSVDARTYCLQDDEPHVGRVRRDDRVLAAEPHRAASESVIGTWAQNWFEELKQRVPVP